MSIEYEVLCDEKDRFRVAFKNAPENLLGLRMSPVRLEQELSKGDWLVLCFAIWDSRDRPTIGIASQLAIENPSMRVAVRPFEVADEFATWAPELQVDVATVVETNTADSRVSIRIVSDKNDHPLWLKFTDGRLCAALIGSRSLDEVVAFIDPETAGR